jgi:predicted nucleotidyltransferase component of viral defense system
VDVLIDRRELLSKARKRNLNLNIVEKDYILGWLLYGFSRIHSLVFKGGTALSKIYFPEIWRLSEDLDFSFLEDDFSVISRRVPELFKLIDKNSGIKLNLKSEFSNPDYYQLKIQYQGVIGRNWIKVDFTKDDLVDDPVLKPVKKEYSDNKSFKIKVESVEEIFCSKFRTVIERKKSRDYFDLWKLTKASLDFDKTKKILSKKLKVKGIELISQSQIFPQDINEILRPYWERELGRLLFPLPDLDLVLEELRIFLKHRLLLKS